MIRFIPILFLVALPACNAPPLITQRVARAAIAPSPVPRLVILYCTVPPGCAIRFYYATNLLQSVWTWPMIAESRDGRLTNSAALPAEFFAARSVDINTGIESDFAK